MSVPEIMTSCTTTWQQQHIQRASIRRERNIVSNHEMDIPSLTPSRANPPMQYEMSDGAESFDLSDNDAINYKKQLPLDFSKYPRLGVCQRLFQAKLDEIAVLKVKPEYVKLFREDTQARHQGAGFRLKIGSLPTEFGLGIRDGIWVLLMENQDKSCRKTLVKICRAHALLHVVSTSGEQYDPIYKHDVQCDMKILFPTNIDGTGFW